MGVLLKCGLLEVVTVCVTVIVVAYRKNHFIPNTRLFFCIAECKKRMLSKDSIRKFEKKYGRSVSLRRQFNRQQLLHGGQKRKRAAELPREDSKAQADQNEMPPVQQGFHAASNVPNLLPMMDCKEAIRFMTMNHLDPSNLPEVKIEDPEYDEKYALSKMRELSKPTLCNGNERCLKYYARCMWLHLKKKYGIPRIVWHPRNKIKACWYTAISRGNVDDYERFTMITDTTTIGEKAFYYSSIMEITIPSSVTTIGKNAFRGDVSWDDKELAYDEDRQSELSNVTFQSPSSLLIIGEWAFAGNRLMEITIPSSVTTIEKYAFSDNQLMSISIPSSVTTIGYHAFYKNQLTSVTIPSSVEYIYGYAFAENQLTEITIPSSVKEISFHAFVNNKLTNVTFESPSSVRTIGEKAFYNNKLASIVIPSSVTSIGSNLFAHNELRDLIIPSSIKKIPFGAFSSNQLSNVTFESPSSVTTIEFAAFARNALTDIIIPDSVTRIGDGVFSSNQLTSVTLPSSIQIIEDYTFADNQLTSVTIPSSVRTIKNCAFRNNKLTSVTFESPSSVTTIGQSAFRWNLLGEVTIPSSVETIDREAFLNNKLTNVTFESASSVSATTNRISRSWSAKSSCIARKAFVGNPLTSITIPSSFEIIENDAFEKQVHIVRE